MSPVWLLVTVIMYGDAGQDPMSIIPKGLMGYKECTEMKDGANLRAPELVDAVNGRPIMYKFSDCIPQDAQVMQSQLQTFIESPEGQK